MLLVGAIWSVVRWWFVLSLLVSTSLPNVCDSVFFTYLWFFIFLQILLARGASRLTLNCNGYRIELNFFSSHFTINAWQNRFPCSFPFILVLSKNVLCFRWLPLDVARMWARHWLEPLLAPNSDSVIPNFPSSNYLSLPLMSVLNIAR